MRPGEVLALDATVRPAGQASDTRATAAACSTLHVPCFEHSCTQLSTVHSNSSAPLFTTSLFEQHPCAFLLCLLNFAQRAGDPPASHPGLLIPPHLFSVHHHRIRYFQAGDKGPCLLLLHGFGVGAYHWERNIKELSQSCRVFAVDVLGQGEHEGISERNGRG